MGHPGCGGGEDRGGDVSMLGLYVKSLVGAAQMNIG